MRPELQQIKMHVYEDGKIDQSEVAMLRGLVEASGASEEEVRLLLDINNVLSGSDLNADFIDLMVGAVAGFVLGDTNHVSDEKLDWLEKHVLKDGAIDENEQRILREIETKAASVPTRLTELMGSAA